MLSHGHFLYNRSNMSGGIRPCSTHFIVFNSNNHTHNPSVWFLEAFPTIPILPLHSKSWRDFTFPGIRCVFTFDHSSWWMLYSNRPPFGPHVKQYNDPLGWHKNVGMLFTSEMIRQKSLFWYITIELVRVDRKWCYREELKHVSSRTTQHYWFVITVKASLKNWSHTKYLFWDLTTETVVLRWCNATVKKNCRIEGQNLRDVARMVVCYYRKHITRRLIVNTISLLRPHIGSILCWDEAQIRSSVENTSIDGQTCSK